MPVSALSSLSRRGFHAAAVSSPLVAALSAASKPLVGLELFSVRQELAKDLFGTVRGVAKVGYEAVEFFSPYYQWEPAYARQVRQLLDRNKAERHIRGGMATRRKYKGT